jgi:hypothetical protein
VLCNQIIRRTTEHERDTPLWSAAPVSGVSVAENYL